MDLMTLSCIAAFAPLAGSILAGLLGWKLGRSFSHWVTILSVAISFAASVGALMQVWDGARMDAAVYQWISGDGFTLQVGFLIDRLTVTLNRWEQVKKFTILDHDLTIEGGDLTPSLKLRRKAVSDKYRSTLEAGYGG